MASADRVRSHRRYLFLKARALLAAGEPTYSVFDAKRLDLPGTVLPLTLPYRSAVIAAGYLVLEELQGADAAELTKAGLTPQQAARVVAAV